ncbi:MAG TPA: GNAT family protein [Marmoricola sp.]|nr:GNAT family protein [Marmoricola sp.]
MAQPTTQPTTQPTHEYDAEELARRVAERDRSRFEEQARAAIARLEADPGDPVGRGALGEAVEELRRQPGRPSGEELPDWLVSAREQHLTPVPPELPVRTERLLLRAPTMADLDALVGWYGREDVAHYLLTPATTREEMAAHLLRRTGADPDGPPNDVLSLVVELEGEVVGDLVLFLKPPSYSQAEIGWTLHPDHAGRGIATEAARALVDLAFGHYRLHRVYADLDARNDRSQALCKRLGMRQELHGVRDFWSKGEWTDTRRYAVLREEHAATSRPAENGSTPAAPGDSIAG